MMLGVMGCTQAPVEQQWHPLADSTDPSVPVIFCGKAELINVDTDRGYSAGIFELQNDAHYLWVTFTPASGMWLQSVALYVGSMASYPRQGDGGLGYDRFPIQARKLQQQSPWSARIPLAQLDSCVFVAGSFSVRAGDETPATGSMRSGKGDSLIPGVQYCIQGCAGTEECDLDHPGHHPQTIPQAAWAAEETQELAMRLREAFPKMYPEGMVIGCDHQVRFETANDALGSLPMTGKAAPLKATLAATKPGMVDNHLLGELLTLELATRLDAYDPDFSEGDVPLASLQVAKGAFEGWTLQEVQQEANRVLGACASNYTPEQFDEVLRGINANFVKGKSSGDYLRCPR